MQEARAHLEAVTQEAADPALSARRAAARQRGAQQRLERLEAALKQIPDVTETKQRSGAKDATVRVSTTDPDARIMKMGDGGFRPAFNVQFATVRHATALHLLQSGVDLNTVRCWLGHASVVTTNRYVEIDLEAKRAALEGTKALHEGIPPPVVRDESLIRWLESL
jgi:site-specific recombinase XerC